MKVSRHRVLPFNHTASGKSQTSERLACPPWTHTQRGTPPSETCVTSWTLPRPTPPRLHQALPQPGAPRHPEDPDPLKPAHCEHFPSKPRLRGTSTPNRGDTCLTGVRDWKVPSYPLCKSSGTPTFKDNHGALNIPVSGVSHKKPH